MDKLSFSTLLLLLVFGNSLNACSCTNTLTVERAVDYYKYVLISSVESKEVIEIRDSSFLGLAEEPYIHYLSKYTLNIEYLYKGRKLRKKKTIDIYTGMGGGDCGYHFKVGKKYIIYGSSIAKSHYHSIKNELPKNIVYTDMCDKTIEHSMEMQLEIEKHKRRKSIKKKYNPLF